MQSVKLNLIPGAVLPVVNVSQYDVKRTFQLAVYDGAASYDLTGKTVTIRGTKPDNHGFDYGTTDGVVSVSGNTVTISTTQQMTAVGGQVMAELRIESGTTVIGTLNFIIDVEPSALSDDTDISDTEIPVIERDFEAALAEAEADALVAEGYAKGTQGGVPVESGSPYYHDNAKHYKEEAEEAASGVLEKYPKIVSDYWYIWDVDTEQYVNTGVRAKGTQGDPGQGVPAGGTTGQVLRKKSDDNYDTEWANGGGGASALDDLTDVDITSPASGQGLLYDGAEWVNGAVATPDQIKGLGQTNAVNECPNDATSQVINGVTFTVNSDGTVSLSGTASAVITYNIHLWANNTYNPTPYRRLTGCPSGGSNITYMLRFIREGSFSRNDYGDGVLVDTTLTGGFYVRLAIASGINCTGLVFKPMLSDARLNLHYEDYVPYAMSNKELTDVNDVSGITYPEQSVYSVRAAGTYFYKVGKIAAVSIFIKSLTADSYPSGLSWTKIAQGLPKPYKEIVQNVPPGAADLKLMQLYLNENGELNLRGGTISNAYDYSIFLSYITK